MSTKHISLAALVVASTMAAATPSMAGGFLADVFVRPFSPKAADDLDNWHRKLKDANPVYKGIEEGASGAVRNIIRTFPDRIIFRGIM